MPWVLAAQPTHLNDRYIAQRMACITAYQAEGPVTAEQHDYLHI